MTCAFLPCDETETCAFEGGCIRERFAHVPKYLGRSDPAKKNQWALAGLKPRPTRDPAKIKRTRKAL